MYVYTTINMCIRLHYCKRVCVRLHHYTHVCVRVHYCTHVCVPIHYCTHMCVLLHYCKRMCVRIHHSTHVCVRLHYCTHVCVQFIPVFVHFCGLTEHFSTPTYFTHFNPAFSSQQKQVQETVDRRFCFAVDIQSNNNTSLSVTNQ